MLVQPDAHDDDIEFYDALEEFDEEDAEGPSKDAIINLGNGNTSQQAEISTDAKFQLHEAAFVNNYKLLETRLPLLAPEDAQALDPHGNNILHIAVMRGNLEAVQSILASNFPVNTKSCRGWTALDEALVVGDRDLVTMLTRASIARQKAALKEQRKMLLRTLQDLPDYSMQLKWEFGSPVPGVGMLLRNVAPHDVYHIWKCGCRVRVDGSLMGIKSDSVIPQYKRGHFSLLFDGSGGKEQVFYLNRKKESYIDLTTDAKSMKANEEEIISAEVDQLMASATTGVDKTKFKAGDVKFTPLKGWLGGDMKEKLEGWNTTVYEATAHMVAFTKTKHTITIPKDATFQEYLAMSFPEDTVVEALVSPFSPSTYSNEEPPFEEEPPAPEQRAKADKKVRKVSGRCWMAANFPMSLKQLLPLLDIVGEANKHMRKVSKFMNKYGNMNMFPVKVQIPLVYTLYAMLAFKHFRALTKEETQDSFFTIPANFQKKSLKEALDRVEQQHMQQQDEPGRFHVDINGNITPVRGSEASRWGASSDTAAATQPPTPTTSDVAVLMVDEDGTPSEPVRQGTWGSGDEGKSARS